MVFQSPGVADPFVHVEIAVSTLTACRWPRSAATSLAVHPVRGA
jgi:hypothetical protein